MKKLLPKRLTLFIIIVLTIFSIILVAMYILYPPKLYLIGKKKIILEYSKKFEEPGYYSKNFFGNVVNSKVEIDNNINYEKIGTYNINYHTAGKFKVFKNEQVRNVQLVDSTAPIIELHGEDVIIILNGQAYIEPGYYAFDEYDGELTSKVIVSNDVNTSINGEYEITYMVQDSSSNKTEMKRKIIVTDYNAVSIPVLTYHSFMSDAEKSIYAPNDKYVMSESQLEQQLKYLSENDYNTITLDDFYLWYKGKKVLGKKDVVITFDDGLLSNYIYAIPLLKKYNQVGTVFVITSRIANYDVEWDPQKNLYFSEKIIDDILNNHKNIKLESHTHELHGKIDDSCAMSKKTEEEIYNDVIMSKKILNSEYLAYPFGCYNENTFKALEKANYKMAFSFNGKSRATRNDNIYSIERININSYVSMNEFIKWLEE